MQTNHSKSIKGLSIAVIVISAISIFSCVVGLFALGAGAYAWDQYGTDAIVYAQNHPDHSMAAHIGDNSFAFYYDEDDLFGIMGFLLTLSGVLVVWELASSVVTLVAGIVGLRRSDEHPRMSSVFGWGIAGAIAAGVGGRFITCVLLVIVAVFANKDKNMSEAEYQGAFSAHAGAASAPYAGYTPNAQTSWEQSVAGFAPQPSASQQPGWQSPASGYQATYGQPVQPAGTQPIAYGQPLAGQPAPMQPAPLSQPAATQPAVTQPAQPVAPDQQGPAGETSEQPADQPADQHTPKDAS